MSILSLAALLSASLLTAPASAPEARERTESSHRAHDRGGRDFCGKIECSADQKDQLAKIRSGLRSDLESLHARKAELRRKLAAEYADDRPDAKVLDDLLSQIKALDIEKTNRVHAAMLRIHGVLTPAQRVEAADRFAAMTAGGGERGKHAKHRGGPERQGKREGFVRDGKPGRDRDEAMKAKTKAKTKTKTKAERGRERGSRFASRREAAAG